MNEHKKKDLIYLIDDLPSELDFQSKDKLISLLAQQNAQIFITAIDDEMINEVLRDSLTKVQQVFHVEHGTMKTKA